RHTEADAVKTDFLDLKRAIFVVGENNVILSLRNPLFRCFSLHFYVVHLVVRLSKTHTCANTAANFTAL
ncbi:hypothetical protein ACYTX7_09470, partial [Streptococcus pyogenes]